MTENQTLRRAFLGGAASVMLVAGGALAPANAAIEEIIVTAQKRAQNLQDVPISISTLNGDELEDIFMAGADILALAARIPSFYAESSNGRVAPRFYIRGLGNTDFDLAASQPVSMYIDEVVMENVVLKSTPLFDVQQVEVLRGPQGSLFGRNTSAGIIKFSTNRPSQETELSVSSSIGTFGSTTSQLVLNAPLTSTLSGRISVHMQDRDDWINNSFTGEHDALGGFVEKAARAQILWEPSEATSVLLNVHSRELEGTAAVFRANILGPNGLTKFFDRDVVDFDQGANNPQAYDGLGYSLRYEHAFDSGLEMTYIGAHEETDGSSRGDIDGGNMVADYTPYFIPFPSDTEDRIDEHNQNTHEVRLSSQGNESINWQIGAYYFDSELQITTNAFGCCSATVAHDNEAWAVFGQMEFVVDDDVDITGGLRYTDEEKDFRALAVSPPPWLLPLPPVDPVSVTDSQVSWDIALNWAWTDVTNLYGRASSGYRGPSIQGRDVAFGSNPSTAVGENNLSFEAGSKSDLWNDRARLNMALYSYVVEDLQVSAVGGVDNLIQLVNLDKAKGYGFEADAEFVMSEFFTLSVGYSFNHTEISDKNLRVGVCGSGQCTVTDSVDLLGAVVDGNPLPQAPEHILNLVADYRRASYGDSEFFASADLSYQGETNLFLYEAKEFAVSGQHEIGFKTGFAKNDGSWEIALFGRNITDEENIKGAIDFNNNTGFVNDPRVIGLSVSARY